MARMTQLRMRRFGWLFGGVAVALLFTGACSSMDSASESPAGAGPNMAGDGSSNGAAGGNYAPTVGAGGSNAAGIASLPAEVKTNVDFEAPQASIGYVYATNPALDTVAVIDAKTLGIQIVETGDEPRFLRTIPGKDAALLVDVAAGDLAYLATKGGTSTVSYLNKLPAANAIAVAPDGKHALAYFDVTRLSQGKVSTLQDVTALSLAGDLPVATRMTIGFKARQVTFAGGSEGSDAAYVVTDDGVSVLNFAEIDAKGSGIAKTVPIFSAVEQNAADVTVTPDGKFALGRLENTSTIRFVDLATGTVQSLELRSLLGLVGGTGNAGTGGASSVGGTSGTSTGTAGAAGAATSFGGASSGTTATAPAGTLSDLELSADGTYAIAVSRDTSNLLRIPIPGGISDPSQIKKTSIAGVLFGSAALSPNGHWAVLYTSVASEERVVIVDLTKDVAPHPVDLTKAVLGVTFSSSGDQAFIVHQKAAGDPNEANIAPDVAFDRSYGYSLLDLPSGFRKLTVTETAPLFSVAVPNKPYVFLTFSGTDYKVQRINTDSLVGDEIDLGTQPVSMGVVPSAGRVFVNQNHPEGRMTFIDWETMATRSVTGYELNSMVRE